MASKGWIALSVLCLGASLALPALAAADTEDIIQPQNETFDQGFQSGTCYENDLEGSPPEGPKPKQCSPETPEAFFKQAGGHPPFGFTQYIIRHAKYTPLGEEKFLAPIETPIIDRTIKTLRTDLPPGLTVNPEATTSRCSLAEFLNKVKVGEEELFVPTCKAETKVGEERVTLVTNKPEVKVGEVTIPVTGYVIPPIPGGTKVALYNLEPVPGEPAKLGFVINGKVPVFLETEVAWESDFHESFTIKLLNTAEASGLSTLISRLISFGDKAGNGTYVTNPTTCYDPNQAAYENLYTTWFRAESYGEPNPTFPTGSTPVASPLPFEGEKRVMQEGCGEVPFDISLKASVDTALIDSPTGGTFEVNLPYDPEAEGGEGLSQSHLKSSRVTLPRGMGINPSGSIGLESCTDAQFKKGVRVYENECPSASKIGTATIESPPLAEALVGDVYVGEQKSMDPSSGEEFRILVEAKGEHEGIDLRLVGHVIANPSTGQVTGVFDEQLVGPFAGKLPQGLPQTPFTSVKLSFEKSKAVLTTPPTCSTADTNGEMEPWARPGTTAPVSSSFTLSSDPGGGSCPQTLAGRKFAPGYSANSDSTTAGAYSPFRVNINRTDGQQEIKLVDVTLPPGLSGNLAGIPYCSEAAVAAASGKAGKEEQASPSCSDASKIGTTRTTAGTGGAPLTLPGNVYLAGPYKGAPLSLAVITPAVSGPFDLGTVVVRVALNVNPLTAQVNAVSDAIPDVYGGVELDIRKIDFDVDRPQFMVNPTNCQTKETAGAINGGGGNPADPAAWSSYAVSAPFQPVGCKNLKFKPKLHIRLKGRTRRGGFPQLRAVLEARKHDANVARTALNLSHAFFVEQGHMKKVCTRPQLAAQTCPGNTVYGHAEAKSPLLSGKLKGPVYLVPGGHTLPDLVADLRGQVNIQLHGVISTKHGGIKTVFNATPDVPVTKFILNMGGGKNGLIVNSTNICKTKRQAILNIKGQNGKKVKTNHFRLNLASCPKRKAHKQSGGNG